MKYILILSRDGKEKMDYRFDAPTTKDAVTKAKTLILKEHKKRQAEFPFTPEPPSDAILFREWWKRMPKIRIIAIPPGQAPKEIREQWVGLEMSLFDRQDTASFVYGILRGDPPQDMNGFRVDTDEAICALVEKNSVDSSMAARWWINWRENTPIGVETDSLSFPKEVCELIP